MKILFFILLILELSLTGCTSTEMIKYNDVNKYTIIVRNPNSIASFRRGVAIAEKICRDKNLSSRVLRQVEFSDASYLIMEGVETTAECFNAEVEKTNQDKKSQLLSNDAAIEKKRLEKEQAAYTDQMKKAASRYQLREEKRRQSLISSGIYEIDIIKLIVNINEYKNKKVLIRCTESGHKGTYILCGNEKHNIKIDVKSINKKLHEEFLHDCAYLNGRSGGCSAEIVGTVSGSVEPILMNAYKYKYTD